MRVHRQRDRGRFHPLLKILLCVVLIAGVSFTLAWVWQTVEQTAAASPEEQASSAPEEDEHTSPLSNIEAQSAPMASVSSSERPSSDVSALENPDEEVGSSSFSHVLFDSAVPESDPVDASYFDDAIFLGDSITTGIPLYHIADNAAVVAMTGINTQNINDRLCIRLNDDSEERVTVLDAAKTHGERGKVYIMLGSNGLGYDKATFIAGYATFLASVKELYPNAIIYLQSMTPVVEGYVNEFDPTLDNNKINEYNLEIMELAKMEKVYYLDVASVLKDESGALPLEASPVDGMHFTPEYYAKWFEYLKTHTVEVEK